MIVLNVHALPRGEESRTRKLQRAFLDTLHAQRSNCKVVSLDLAAGYKALPAFDAWDIQAKYEMAYGDGSLDADAAVRWTALTKLTDQLHRASMVVISAPMWNLSIPWYLKRWLDAVVQARLTFEYVDGQYRGLLTGRTGVLLTTRDSAFGEGSPLQPLDFQLPYLRTILGFMGIDPIHEVVAEPMMAQGIEAGEVALATAIERAQELARSL